MTTVKTHGAEHGSETQRDSEGLRGRIRTRRDRRHAATGDTSPTPAWIRESLLHSTAWNAGHADAVKALRASAVAR